MAKKSMPGYRIQALKAFKKARRHYQSQVKVASRVVHGPDQEDEDVTVATMRHQDESVKALVHAAALDYGRAYAKARAVGCFK